MPPQRYRTNWFFFLVLSWAYCQGSLKRKLYLKVTHETVDYLQQVMSLLFILTY